MQVTYGCSHNSCAFCDMYDDKHFSMRPMQEIREDFELARRVYHRVERVFLADGDALMRKTDELIEILGLIYGLFPECERVTCYASPTSPADQERGRPCACCGRGGCGWSTWGLSPDATPCSRG